VAELRKTDPIVDWSEVDKGGVREELAAGMAKKRRENVRIAIDTATKEIVWRS
jgi:hypothetical protein